MNGILASPGGSGHDGRVCSVDEQDIRTDHRGQRAIVQRAGLNPMHQSRRHSRIEFEINRDDKEVYDSIRIPTFLGFSVEAYGEGEGPINFSGKFFTAWWASRSIIKGFETMGRCLKENKFPDHEDFTGNGDPGSDNNFGVSFRTEGLFDVKRPEDAKFMDIEMMATAETTDLISPIVSRTRNWDYTVPPAQNLRGTSEALDRYVGINPANLTAYPEWSEISWGQWVRFALANLFGLALQWGTCGPAIWVTYFSPPCRLPDCSRSKLVRLRKRRRSCNGASIRHSPNNQPTQLEQWKRHNQQLYLGRCVSSRARSCFHTG
jgi:hypothetical protein